MTRTCAQCGAELICLAGCSAHPNNWYCSNPKCGWQAWDTVPVEKQREDEIREREKKATKGPWYKDHENVRWQSDENDYPQIADTFRLHNNCADADFIAHARDDIPYLLSRLDQAREDIKLLRDDCDRLRRELDDCNGVIR